ncbi:MAG: proline--tRNA ligase [Bacillota bacterium]
MKLSKYYMPTLREVPTDADIPSHQLMLRAGMMRPLSSGVYSYLPLGYRVIRKVEEIVREEMDKSGALEVLLPTMQTAEIWQESERWRDFGPLMIRFEDRKQRQYCLGPTHEEVISDLIRDEIRSYKDLPYNLYQIQTKVRDEIRPRFGLLRAREFIMKDAYTLDTDYDGLDKQYQVMYDTYNKIFSRCGLDVRVVEADSGAMGGPGSHEFMVLADTGEDELAFCTECDYAANVERAEAYMDMDLKEPEVSDKEIEEVFTPEATTIADLEEMLGLPASRMIKTMAYFADGQPVVALLRADDQLNEIKLRNHFSAVELRPAHPEEFSEHFGSVAGFIGPIGLAEDVKIIADPRIKELSDAVVGANKKDYHFINVTPQQDLDNIEDYTVLRKVQAGDVCPKCQGRLEIKSGIEVGHIFKLGTKYSESMDATYLDENGRETPIVMGSYGIGVTRLVAAAIEQYHDDKGIIWPVPIAPFKVIILPLGQADEVTEAAEELYANLEKAGIETLLDDRSERAGVKFNDAELIGIPLRITIGSRSLKEGKFELQIRKNGEETTIPQENAVEEIKSILTNIT